MFPILHLLTFKDKEDAQRTKWLWNKSTHAEKQGHISKDTITVNFICQQNKISNCQKGDSP